MKNFKRIFAALITFVILVSSAMSMFSASAAGATVYQCDLGVNKTKSGQFEFMAYDVSAKLFHELETTAKATWSPDWPCHFVPGEDVYTVSKSELTGALIDLMCDKNNNWGSVVAFTAPEAGSYNVVAELNKFSGKDSNGLVCYVDILLVKGGEGYFLYKEEKLDYGEVKWVKKNLELAEGEKVYILVIPNAESTKSSSQNVALNSFIVTANAKTSDSDQTTGSNQTNPDQTTGSNQTNPDQTTGSNQTTAPENTGAQGTTAPNNTDNNEKASNDNVMPIVIVCIVGGVLLVGSIVALVILKAKSKK